jgi:hypothetical protein
VEITLCDRVRRERSWVMVTAMAKVIEYYIPERFRKTVRWVPPAQRGKVIDFPVLEKKSA